MWKGVEVLMSEGCRGDGGVVLSRIYTQHGNNNNKKKKHFIRTQLDHYIIYAFKNVYDELYIDHTQACIYNVVLFSWFFLF